MRNEIDELIFIIPFAPPVQFHPYLFGSTITIYLLGDVAGRDVALRGRQPCKGLAEGVMAEQLQPPNQVQRDIHTEAN